MGIGSDPDTSHPLFRTKNGSTRMTQLCPSTLKHGSEQLQGIKQVKKLLREQNINHREMH